MTNINVKNAYHNIYIYFIIYDCNFILEKKFLKRKRSKKDERGSTSSSQRHIQDGSGDRDDNGDPDPGHEDMELRKGQCPYCFISACVATSNITAPWVGNGQPPSNANAQIRKGIYRRFWKCINNMYGWLLPQYLDKKKSWWWRMGCYAPAGNYAGVCCGTC